MLKELMLVFKEIELMIDFVDLDYILIKFVKLFDVDLGINFFIVILERFKQVIYYEFYFKVILL